MSALNLPALRRLDPHIVCLGSYPGIIQSILDFDYLAGRDRSSIVGIVATGRNMERYFFGSTEIAIPVYASVEQIPVATRDRANLFLNLSSGRRVLSSSLAAMAALPHLAGGVVFAEGLPERHAIELAAAATKAGLWIIGGASVGLMLPAHLKLGAIGGVQARQLEQSRLFEPGSVAVVSSSGGMVNEIIRTVANAGHHLSFSLALGGERFPMLTPADVFLAAQADPDTKTIVYFGELGGGDEYLLVDLIKAQKVTKPVIAYIAGTVAELFDTPPQFGHAKAMAARADESARAKAEALRAVGVKAALTFAEFVAAIRAIPGASSPHTFTEIRSSEPQTSLEQPTQAPNFGDITPTGPATPQPFRSDALAGRRKALIASSVSRDTGTTVEILGQDLLDLAEHRSFAAIAVSMFLGRPIKSKELEQFVDFVLRLLVDHGPYVSGAVNTIVTARAGRDLESALAAGLLTIGPRFGGAINQAAATWLQGVASATTPAALVETLAAKKQYISGIGHRKYRVDLPDPRVAALLQHAKNLKPGRFTAFARGVEDETVRKKGNLILNVDGTIAAILLDLLSEKEHYTDTELRALVDTGFFNALFVLSRSVGFMAHYFDQVRLDEGLFRLRPDDVTSFES
jgi:ATP citrate (pro-S)-lyase